MTGIEINKGTSISIEWLGTNVAPRKGNVNNAQLRILCRTRNLALQDTLEAEDSKLLLLSETFVFKLWNEYPRRYAKREVVTNTE
jgi:hypothetical protein